MDTISRLDSGRGLLSIHQPWLTFKRDLLGKGLCKKHVSEKDEREERECWSNWMERFYLNTIKIKNASNRYKLRMKDR